MTDLTTQILQWQPSTTTLLVILFVVCALYHAIRLGVLYFFAKVIIKKITTWRLEATREFNRKE